MLKSTWIFMLLCAACLCSHDRATAATITLSWEGGPAAHPSVNRTRAEGSVATVVATVTGFEQPVLAVQVWIRVGSQYAGMPDAWRFDPGGCADGGFSTPEIAIDPSCPFLTGTNPRRIVDIREDFAGREQARYVLAHDATPVSAATRYTVAQFRFDLGKAFAGLGTKPDSCGCIDQPQAVFLQNASWLGADGVEYAFTLANECLGWEDPNNTVGCPFFGGCDLCGPEPQPPTPVNPCSNPPTPVAQRSWGSIKASYR